MSTSHRWVLETRGSQLIMPNNFPDTTPNIVFSDTYYMEFAQCYIFIIVILNYVFFLRC